jgi:hypothetical protein
MELNIHIKLAKCIAENYMYIGMKYNLIVVLELFSTQIVYYLHDNISAIKLV